MFTINKFLSRFEKLTPPDDVLKTYISACIYDKTYIQVPKKNIKIKQSSIFITADAVVKNEIFLNKDSILKKVNGQFGKKINNIF